PWASPSTVSRESDRRCHINPSTNTEAPCVKVTRPAGANRLKLGLRSAPSIGCAGLPWTIQNWQHWKDVRKRADGQRYTTFDAAPVGAARESPRMRLFSPVRQPWRRLMARKRKTSAGPSDRQLDEMIEEATVDAYDEEEQATGFYTMIDDNLALPFRTRIL